MKIRGKGAFQSFLPSDEVPHPVGNDLDWNESVVIYVWDVEQDVYVFFRIGHESNRGAHGLRVFLGYRDRSWGVRKWETMRAHTWIPVVFGKDLSLQMITWYASNKSLGKFGYVLKNDEIIVPITIDVVSFVEIDGITNRGGKIVLTLDDGETLECVYSPIGPGGVSDHHKYPVRDTLCTVVLNRGERVGVGCYEAGFNAMGGLDLPNPDTLIGGRMRNGIFPFERLAKVL
jgi:hypothetical protein